MSPKEKRVICDGAQNQDKTEGLVLSLKIRLRYSLQILNSQLSYLNPSKTSALEIFKSRLF